MYIRGNNLFTVLTRVPPPPPYNRVNSSGMGPFNHWCCNNFIVIPTVKNHEKIQIMSHSQKNLVYKAAKFLQQVLWWFRECPDLSSKIEIASGLDNHKAVQKMKVDPIWQKNIQGISRVSGKGGKKYLPPMESINGMLHLQLQLFNNKLTGVTGKRCCDIWKSKLDVGKWNCHKKLESLCQSHCCCKYPDYPPGIMAVLCFLCKGGISATQAALNTSSIFCLQLTYCESW